MSAAFKLEELEQRLLQAGEEKTKMDAEYAEIGSRLAMVQDEYCNIMEKLGVWHHEGVTCALLQGTESAAMDGHAVEDNDSSEADVALLSVKLQQTQREFSKVQQGVAEVSAAAAASEKRVVELVEEVAAASARASQQEEFLMLERAEGEARVALQFQAFKTHTAAQAQQCSTFELLLVEKEGMLSEAVDENRSLQREMAQIQDGVDLIGYAKLLSDLTSTELAGRQQLMEDEHSEVIDLIAASDSWLLGKVSGLRRALAATLSDFQQAVLIASAFEDAAAMTVVSNRQLWDVRNSELSERLQIEESESSNFFDVTMACGVMTEAMLRQRLLSLQGTLQSQQSKYSEVRMQLADKDRQHAEWEQENAHMRQRVAELEERLERKDLAAEERALRQQILEAEYTEHVDAVRGLQAVMVAHSEDTVAAAESLQAKEQQVVELLLFEEEGTACCRILEEQYSDLLEIQRGSSVELGEYHAPVDAEQCDELDRVRVQHAASETEVQETLQRGELIAEEYRCRHG